MIIYEIGSVERFLNLVDRSRGDIYMEFTDCSRKSLKQDAPSRKPLRVPRLQNEGISILFEDQRDMPSFARHLMDSCL